MHEKKKTIWSWKRLQELLKVIIVWNWPMLPYHRLSELSTVFPTSRPMTSGERRQYTKEYRPSMKGNTRKFNDGSLYFCHKLRHKLLQYQYTLSCAAVTFSLHLTKQFMLISHRTQIKLFFLFIQHSSFLLLRRSSTTVKQPFEVRETAALLF